MDDTKNLAGKRILVVEDELFVGMDITEALERAGASALGPVMDRSSAQQISDFYDIDAAIVDFKVGGGGITPLANDLYERNIPFLVYTGNAAFAREAGLDRYAKIYEKPLSTKLIVQYTIELLEKSYC